MTAETPRRAARRKRNLMRRMAEHQDDLCFLCEKQMVFLPANQRHENHTGNGGDFASMHHVVPRSLGGHNRLTNLVVTHRSCNSVVGKRPPTVDELVRLDALNERRAEMLTEIRGIISAESFGQETPASLYLVDLLEEIEGHEAVKARRMVTTTITRMAMELAAIDKVHDNRMWERIAKLIVDDAITKSEALNTYGDIGNATRSVMRAFHNQRREKRGVLPDPVRSRRINDQRRERYKALQASEPA